MYKSYKTFWTQQRWDTKNFTGNQNQLLKLQLHSLGADLSNDYFEESDRESRKLSSNFSSTRYNKSSSLSRSLKAKTLEYKENENTHFQKKNFAETGAKTFKFLV